MEDEKIIDLYWERKDEAIMETQKAYGRQLQTIAQRIVQSYEDAEESVNDTYLAAWRTIPPKRPSHFRVSRQNLPEFCLWQAGLAGRRQAQGGGSQPERRNGAVHPGHQPGAGRRG